MTDKQILEEIYNNSTAIRNELSEIKKALLRIAANSQKEESMLEFGLSTDLCGDSLSSKIDDTLKLLGVPCRLDGFDYLSTAILYCLENYGEKMCFNKELYPYIAKKYDSTPSRVERSIRHAIEVVVKRGNYEYLNMIFEDSYLKGEKKLTILEFITTITKALKKKV